MTNWRFAASSGWPPTKRTKSALSGFTEKQAALKNVETENDLADFSQEKPAQSVRDLAKLDVDLDKWKQMLRSTSDLFRSDSGAGDEQRVC